MRLCDARRSRSSPRDGVHLRHEHLTAVARDGLTLHHECHASHEEPHEVAARRLAVEHLVARGVNTGVATGEVSDARVIAQERLHLILEARAAGLRRAAPSSVLRALRLAFGEVRVELLERRRECWERSSHERLVLARMAARRVARFSRGSAFGAGIADARTATMTVVGDGSGTGRELVVRGGSPEHGPSEYGRWQREQRGVNSRVVMAPSLTASASRALRRSAPSLRRRGMHPRVACPMRLTQRCLCRVCLSR